MATNQLSAFLQNRKCQGFTQHPFYSRDGDFLTFFFRDEEYVAERIDDILTVYWTLKGHDTAGFKLKGIRHLVSILEEFRIEAADQNGEFSVGVLFWSGLQLTDNSAAVYYYQKLARESRDIFLPKKELEYA